MLWGYGWWWSRIFEGRCHCVWDLLLRLNDCQDFDTPGVWVLMWMEGWAPWAEVVLYCIIKGEWLALFYYFSVFKRGVSPSWSCLYNNFLQFNLNEHSNMIITMTRALSVAPIISWLYRRDFVMEGVFTYDRPLGTTNKSLKTTTVGLTLMNPKCRSDSLHPSPIPSGTDPRAFYLTKSQMLKLPPPLVSAQILFVPHVLHLPHDTVDKKQAVLLKGT